MSRGVSNHTKKLSVSALLAAMSVAILIIGAFIETLDLSVAAIASFLCVFAVIELGGIYPWLIFAVAGILSIVIMPHSLSGWFYLLFFGYYPILKEKFERLNKYFAWIVKFLLLNFAVFICVAVSSFLFYGGNLLDTFNLIFGDAEKGIYLSIGVYVLVNFVFFVYDIALTKLISFYFAKLRQRFKFLR
jgi:hypothetical protein